MVHNWYWYGEFNKLLIGRVVKCDLWLQYFRMLISSCNVNYGFYCAGVNRTTSRTSGSVSRYPIRCPTDWRSSFETTSSSNTLERCKICGLVWSRLSSKYTGCKQSHDCIRTDATWKSDTTQAFSHISRKSERRLSYIKSVHTWKWWVLSYNFILQKHNTHRTHCRRLRIFLFSI